MATFDEIRLAMQGVQYLDNVRKLLRSQAQSYKDAITRGTIIVNGVTTPAVTALQSIIASNRAIFAQLVSAFQAVLSDNTKKTALTNGLTAIGVALSEANSLVVALNTAITSHATLAIDTGPNITTMANTVLSQTPTLTSIQPET